MSGSKWGESFTDAERAAHTVARRRWAKEGGVPNLWVSDDVRGDDLPSPWAEIRRTVVGRWHRAFRDRRDDDRDELLSYVLLSVAIRFKPAELRAAPALAIAFAGTIVDAEISDLMPKQLPNGKVRPPIRRKRSGLLSLVNDPRRTRQYADDPIEAFEGYDTPTDGAAGERTPMGVCPTPECTRDTEDEMIGALDAQRAEPLLAGLREYLRSEEIDVGRSLFQELGWSDVDFVTGKTDGLASGFSFPHQKGISDETSEGEPNSRDAA